MPTLVLASGMRLPSEVVVREVTEVQDEARKRVLQCSECSRPLPWDSGVILDAMGGELGQWIFDNTPGRFADGALKRLKALADG